MKGENLFTDGSTAEILAALPTLSIPAACSEELCQQRVVIVGGSIGGLATAACLRAAGFRHIQVVEKSTGHREGAGIGLDDASVGILKGLGLQLGSHNAFRNRPDERKENTNNNDIIVQRMRWAEERVVDSSDQQSTVLSKQPYPYSAVRYAELARGLEKVATISCGPYKDTVGLLKRGMKAVQIEENENEVKMHLEDAVSGEASILPCDLVVIADGPRSFFRAKVTNPDAVDKENLRFAGYTAWRGTVPETELPKRVRTSMRKDFPLFSNCLYFLWGPVGKSAVLYDIGNGLVNWLIYECRDDPKAPPGRTTTTATSDDIALLKQHAKADWGEGLGAVIECTPAPFQNDIYDIQTPLTSFTTASGTICLLGDAAHPITPHAAKGSNLAIHDAFLLACAAQNATSVPEMLQLYNQTRVEDCRNTVLFSRHLGRLRNGMPPMTPNGTIMMEEPLPRPSTDTFYLDVVTLFGLPTATLPLNGGEAIQPVWEFVNKHISDQQRGFWLVRDSSPVMKEEAVIPTTKPSLEVVELNHISLETEDVDRLVSFYQGVSGLTSLPRPDFAFGGAWLQLPGGLALHIIERDPLKPGSADDSQSDEPAPERFIRRSHHVALTVHDIEVAKATLDSHGLCFAVNQVPGSPIEQLFFYDPDGNGIEIGNFNA